MLRKVFIVLLMCLMFGALSPSAGAQEQGSQQPPDQAGLPDGSTSQDASAGTSQNKPAPPPEPMFKSTGLMQVGFGSGTRSEAFLVRRAELGFSGQLAPKIKWALSLDPALGERAFRAAYLTLDYIKDVHIDIGRFKIPLSLEGLQSTAKLETIERTLFLSDVNRGGNLGDVVDIGVMISGPIARHVEYQVGFFNGLLENRRGKDDRMAVAGRFVLHLPFVNGLQVGSSGALAVKARPNGARRDRLGAELLFNRGPLTLKSEAMIGKDEQFHRLGYYGLAAYRFTPKVEAVFRYDVFDPDRRHETDSDNVAARDYLAGLNYYIKPDGLKLQVNYLRKTLQITPSHNLILVGLQLSW